MFEVGDEVARDGELVVTARGRGFYKVTGRAKQPGLQQLIAMLPVIATCEWSKTAKAIVYAIKFPDIEKLDSDAQRAVEVELAQIVLTTIKNYTPGEDPNAWRGQ